MRECSQSGQWSPPQASTAAPQVAARAQATQDCQCSAAQRERYGCKLDLRVFCWHGQSWPALCLLPQKARTLVKGVQQAGLCPTELSYAAAATHPPLLVRRRVGGVLLADPARVRVLHRVAANVPASIVSSTVSSIMKDGKNNMYCSTLLTSQLPGHRKSTTPPVRARLDDGGVGGDATPDRALRRRAHRVR